MRDQEHRSQTSDTDEPSKWCSLSEILSFLHDLDVDSARVRPEDIKLLYLVMFDQRQDDPEIEQLRKEFLRRIGPDSAHHLCRYVLHRHKVDRLGDGFTEEDLGSLMKRLVIDVVLLLRHADIAAPGTPTLDLAITAEGALLARLSPDSPNPPNPRAGV